MIVHIKMCDARHILINSLEAGYLCWLGQAVHCGYGTGSAFGETGSIISSNRVESLNRIIRVELKV